MSNKFKAFLDECRIVREHTCSNRPQQNSVAECANRTIAERIVALLEESGLFKKFWAECLAALVHVLSRCLISAIIGKTPYEVWHKKRPYCMLAIYMFGDVLPMFTFRKINEGTWVHIWKSASLLDI